MKIKHNYYYHHIYSMYKTGENKSHIKMDYLNSETKR